LFDACYYHSMAKNKKQILDVAALGPAELDELKKSVLDFVERSNNIDNEIELLKEDRKALVEEFAEKIDMKTLNAVLRIIKIEEGVAHKDTFDLFLKTINEK